MLSENIKTVRKSEGLSQDELAVKSRELGVSGTIYE